MPHNHHLILKQFEQESWHLAYDPSIFDDIIPSLESCYISAQAHGIDIGSKASYATLLEDGGQYTFCEQGVSFQDNIKSQILHSGYKVLHDLSLTLDMETPGECLSVAFNLCSKNIPAFEQLSSLVQDTSLDREPPAQETHAKTRSCPCCHEKKLKIRENAALHPLYSILRSMPHSTFSYNVELHGSQITCLQAFLPSSLQTHLGTVYLRGTGQHLSIDLTEVYNLRLELAPSRGGMTDTRLSLFNSFGEEIAHIHQTGARAYSEWSNLLARHTACA